MSEKHLEPAKTVIAKIGGVDVAAAVTGKHVSRVYRWMYSAEKGGTGGVVPHADARKLLDHSKAEGLDLRPEDFFGASAPQAEVSAA